jgi:amidase
VLIAKSNCPEFAFGVTTENALHGVTRSPWGGASPGGSSGGEAALVASCATAFGVGTDYGGSLRWPAQSTGLVALRTSVGRIPGAGQLPGPDGSMDGSGSWDSPTVQQALQVIGPLARTVADLCLVAGVMLEDQGLVDLGRSGNRPTPELRVAWATTSDIAPLADSVRDGLRGAVAALARSGATTVELPQILADLHETFNGLRGTDPLAEIRAAVVGRYDRLQPSTRALLAAVNDDDPEPWWSRLRALRARVLNDLAAYDVLLVPVAPTSVCSLQGEAAVGDQVLTGFDLMAQCRAVSALGFPALSIPVDLVDGYPVSVQVVGKPGNERVVLAVAALLERAVGGHRFPPWLPPQAAAVSEPIGVAR